MTEDKSDLDFLTTCLVTALKEKRHTVASKLFKIYEEVRPKISEHEQYSNFIASSFYSPTLGDTLDFSSRSYNGMDFSDGDDRLSMEYSPETT